jgi:subtilase family serine protease
MRAQTLLVAGACSFLFGLTSCSDDSPVMCTSGELGCLCGPGFPCVTGLTCELDLCVLGGSGETGDGDPTTGDGDPTTGDGDPTTGDGDPTTGDGDPTTGDGDPTTGDGDPTTGDGDPGPKPNLTLHQFFLSEHELDPGAEAQAYFELANTGPVDTLYQFYYRVVLSVNETLGDDDDITVFEYIFPYAVEANESYLFYTDMMLPETIASGEYFVAMELDTTNVIDESNERDNWRMDADKLKIIGPSQVDLAPYDVSADESEVFVGYETSFSFSVDNLGPDPVGPFGVGLYYSTDQDITVDDVLICSFNEAGIAGNSTLNLQKQCVVPDLSGDYYFGVIVDPNDAIEEINEDNNVAHDPNLVSVATLEVDLQPTEVTTSSHAVDTGDLVSFSTTVINHGPDPSPAFVVAFYYSTDANITIADPKICEANGPTLGAGQSAEVQTQCVVPLLATGSYRLGSMVDPANLIDELNEANNTALDDISVSITAPDVDLAYELHWDNLPNIATIGQNVTYHLQVWNLGSANVTNFEASMHWSTDMIITPSDPLGCVVELGAVPAGALIEFQFGCQIPDLVPGYYYSGVIIDPTNAIPETNENNNVGSSALIQQFQ